MADVLDFNPPAVGTITLTKEQRIALAECAFGAYSITRALSGSLEQIQNNAEEARSILAGVVQRVKNCVDPEQLAIVMLEILKPLTTSETGDQAYTFMFNEMKNQQQYWKEYNKKLHN